MATKQKKNYYKPTGKPRGNPNFGKKKAETIEAVKPEVIPAKEKEQPPIVKEAEELLSLAQIQEKNKSIESGEQAQPHINGKDKIDFPEGVFPTPPEPKLDEQGKELPAVPEPPKKVDLKGRPFNLTIAIDTLVGMVCMFLFTKIDHTILDLTNAEKIYFSELEVKCGINFEINSPWFYFGALTMCYAGKVKTLFMLNKMAKEEAEKEKIEKEKAEAEAKELKEAADLVKEIKEEVKYAIEDTKFERKPKTKKK